MRDFIDRRIEAGLSVQDRRGWLRLRVRNLPSVLSALDLEPLAGLNLQSRDLLLDLDGSVQRLIVRQNPAQLGAVESLDRLSGWILQCDDDGFAEFQFQVIHLDLRAHSKSSSPPSSSSSWGVC